MTNLYDFVQYEQRRSSLEGEWTIITEEQQHSDDSRIEFLTFEELFAGARPSHIQCIALGYRITSVDMLQINTHYNITPIWINCNPGIESLRTKYHPEEDDITNFLAPHYRVIEPVSVADFFASLTGQTYLRIHDRVLPQALSEQSWDTGYAKLIDPEKHSDYIIIATPSSIDEVAGAIHQLSSQSDFSADLYVQAHFGTELPAILLEDIRRTKSLIIIVNHKATESLWLYYETLIKQALPDISVDIRFIFPQFHLVASTLPEYMYEESHFDQTAFIQYLLSYHQASI